jgi:hypothetical protein
MAMMKLLSLHTISSRLGVWESEAVMVYAKDRPAWRAVLAPLVGLIWLSVHTLPHCPRHTPHY